MRLSNHLLLGLASLAALGAATTTTTETETTTTTSSDTTTTTSSEDSSVDPGSLTTTTTATTTLTETTTTTPETTTSQTETTSTTVTVSLTTTATPTTTQGPDIRTLGFSDLTPNNAQTTTVDGQPAFVMNATPNQNSSLSGNVAPPSGAQPGDRVKVTADIIVNLRSPAAGKRQLPSDNTSCDLIMVINNQIVYNRPLVLTGGTAQKVESIAVPSTNPLSLEIIQTCRAGLLSTLTIFNIALEVVRGPPPLTSTDTTASTTLTTSASATTSQPTISGFPEFSNNFKFLGCVGSTENYPTFFLASTDRRMTIDKCTRVCRGFDYAGLHEDGCYCGRAIDGSRTRIVPSQECNIPCPGNHAEFCGGNLLLGISRRQAQPVPNYFRLTVYISNSIIPPPLTTTTTTGHPHPTHVHCHDGRCDPIIIILKPHRGEDCRGEIVYEKIVCNRCDYEHDWVPIRCVDDRCHGKIVYKPEECTRDCGHHIIVEKRPCNDCDGGVVYKPKHTVTVVPPASTRTHHHESKEHTVTLVPPTTTVVPPTSTVVPPTSTQRGNPNERIIVTPTQSTTTSRTATSVPENHVIVSGTGRTNVSMLSAVSAVVFGLFFF